MFNDDKYDKCILKYNLMNEEVKEVGLYLFVMIIDRIIA
jgi:hypothetical protein